MAIRIPSTSLPQQPEQRSAVPGAVVPVQAIGNPAAAGAGLASQAGSLAAKLLQEQRDREIFTRVNEVDIERRKTDAEILDGYHALQGKGAVEQRAKVMSALEQNAKRVRESIKDPEVARVWKQQDQELSLQSSLAADRHYRQQSQIWQADTLSQRAELLQSSVGRVAFAEGYDPATGKLSDEAERTRSAFHSTIGELGTVMGWSAERIQNEQQKADSQALTGVADQLLAEERFQEAGAVLQAHRDKIDPQTAARIEAVVRRGRVDDESQRLATQTMASALTEQRKAAVAKAKGGAAASLRPDFTAAFTAGAAQIDEQYQAGKVSIEVRDHAIARLQNDLSLQKAQQANGDVQAMQSAEQQLRQNPLWSWQDLPANLRESLDNAGRLQDIIDFQRAGKQYVTRPQAFAAALALPDSVLASASPAELFVQFRGVLDDRDLNYLLSRHAAARGGSSKEQRDVLSVEDRIREAARKGGILSRNPAAGVATQEANSEEFYRYRKEIQQRLDRIPHKATDAELQQVIDDVTIDQAWRSVGTDKLLPVSAMSEDDYKTAYVQVNGENIQLSDIPPTEIKKATEALARRGKLPTKQAIAELWVARGKPTGEPAVQEPKTLEEALRLFPAPVEPNPLNRR